MTARAEPDGSFPTFAPTAERAPFWFLGGQARVLLTGAETGNRLALMEFVAPAGHAPPHHVHEDEEEVWFVLDGEVTFFVGDRRHDLAPGQVAHGPRGVPHSYLVRSAQGARIAAVFSPACIEEFFRANGTPVAEAGDMPPEFDLAAVAASAKAFRLSAA
ncbi:cupin domain-containing protein [Streptomyces cocklensis]|jgi:quercetin dioxygenase-like cupin family protein|uniref:Cupin n=1 Tax=Actinacidiphila cocklensis TaxID=887465 RepID=A0A9W4GMY0_9ACTN|nr:cupin domain-containing protein [Actinacidiphila cocklensis]MDD1058560.1 cupin domain-containing protein [Actinacidiphila cocklensis]WSX75231.1 cupin domain-containing protein [Streptomyces sp. NBC_00899]CAG6390731.1 Cupin [Actinacidiphila cocklensis]